MNPPSVNPSPTRRRLLLAGALTGLVLVGGAGAAYAATSADAPADPGPSGYAVVVDESPTTYPAFQADCPYTLTLPEGADR